MPVVEQLLGEMVEVQAEVDQAADCTLSIDQQVRLGQMPPTGPHDDDRERLIGPQPVLATVVLGERQRPAGRVPEVQQRADHIGPGGTAGVLHVGQPHLRTRIEGVDRHLGRCGRAGHLDPPVGQCGRRRSDDPIPIACVLRVGEKIHGLRGRRLLPARGPGGEQLLASGGEALVQLHHEGERVVSEDLLRAAGGPGVGEFDTHAFTVAAAVASTAAATAGATRASKTLGTI